MAEVQQSPAQDAERTRNFEVRVDGARHGAFVDVRDAIDAARIVKRESPQATVFVHDRTTGQVVVEPDA
jgi:hypothetical protein